MKHLDLIPNTVADLVYNTKQDYIDAGQPSSDGTYVLIKSTSPRIRH